MKDTKSRLRGWPVVVVLTVSLAPWAPAVVAQDPAPVTVDVMIAGRAAPNRTVTATATVEIADGSSIESYSWTQTGGVPAVLRGARGANVQVDLDRAAAFRDRLLEVLSEPPIGEEDLPPNVSLPEGEFPAGLQDRFQVVAINPFALEEAGLITLEVEVKTTSGVYRGAAQIHTTLPWKPSPGIKNVPIGNPVLLHGKEQSSYDWSLTAPDGSGATLARNVRTPVFTPDVAGKYVVKVTDRATGEDVVMEIYAGTWRGVIITQNEDGRPSAEGLCMACHNDEIAADKFTPWIETGHAEIFTDSLNTNSHYSSRCFGCHTVGYDLRAKNGGIDEAEDFQAFLDSGMIANPAVENWTRVLEEFPDTAQLANVQCENCHGPQSSEPRFDTLAHGWIPGVTGEPRTSLSSDVCATCHGEPLRHARFQQWQLSGHANYELAIEEGTRGTCARCHTANGFLEWLPVLLGEEPGDPTAAVAVTWTEEETHPQTCTTCHDPHAIGTTSGSDPNATVRISGTTPELIAGFKVVGAGKAAICMTCHNSRRGLRNEANFAEIAGTSEVTRAPHGSSQTDVLMGENAYFTNVGVRGRHSFLEDSCVTCHMEATPPPDLLSYNQGGTNHTFFASKEICAECHQGIGAEVVQEVVDAVSADLRDLIEGAIEELIAAQINAGFTIDLNGAATIDATADVAEIAFGESRGRQAVTVTLSDGTTHGPLRVTDVEVVRPEPLGRVGLYEVADAELVKAGWNWNLVHNDGSRGVHNPTFVLSVLDGARDALGGVGGPRAVLTLDPHQ